MGKKLVDPLAEVKTNPSKVTALMLNPAASRNAGQGFYEPLEKFPTELLACKNLVELEIFRGLTTGTIPPEIGGLAKLESLTIGGLPTKELPATIGDLAKLEVLNIAYLQNLPKLPDSIGKLTKLRDLQAPYAGVTELPASIASCKALRIINFTNSKLASLPSDFWKLAALEELYLPESVRAFPPGIGALNKLRVLSASPQAIASVAGELPSSLRHLQLVGDYTGTSATTLPAELGALSLETMSANFLGLTSLPALPKTLESLDLSGNQLSTLIDTVLALPKLVDLEYTNNPVALAERRELDKLMKQPPGKRVKPAPKPKAKAKKTKGAKLAKIGQVASVNASLSLIIADKKVVADWEGIGEGDDLDGTDWDRARIALAKKDYAMLDIGNKIAVALTLGVGQGIADVFRVGDRFVVVESIAGDTEDELFLEYVASAPQKPKSVANLAVPSKQLVMVPTTDPGDGDEALALDVPAKITITIEAMAKSSWGQARRFFITAT